MVDLNIMFVDKTTVLCSKVLLMKSTLLEELLRLEDRSNDPIPVPFFITDKILVDLRTILEQENIGSFINSKIECLIQMLQTSDFLAIHDTTAMLTEVIIRKVSNYNCFQIFKLTYNLPCFQEISQKSLHLMMTQINEFYSGHELSKHIKDPYVHQYDSMTFQEIEIMISYNNKTSTVAKIMIVKHWLSKNLDCEKKDKILNIIYYINEEACYIPRTEISFMRKIRKT